MLISEGTNAVESGDINAWASILTGFKETSYLSIIIPEISGGVSCWDLEVPPRIDFKECDMSSVKQFLCNDTPMQRHEGFFFVTMNAIWHFYDAAGVHSCHTCAVEFVKLCVFCMR